MGIFDKLFGKKESNVDKLVDAIKASGEVVPLDHGLPEPKKTAAMPKVKKPRKKKETPQMPDAKTLATLAGEPYVAVIGVELDKENIGNGAFELDWNDKFIASLVRAGYQVKPNEPENEIVDRWFQDVCRNVVLETFEQYEANNPRGINRKDIGNGRTEIS